MLTLHALLFFLFSMSVVAAPGLLLAKYDTDKPQKPPSKPSSPHIPQEAYGCWYRLSGGHRPIISDEFMDDVMLLDDPTAVQLFQLLDQPGHLRFVRILQNHELARFVGHWIRYPIPGDSKESRGDLLIATFREGRLAITIDVLIPSSERLRLTHAHVDFNDNWYRLYNHNTLADYFNDIMQIRGFNTDNESIKLYTLPDPTHQQPEFIMIDEMVNEHHFQTLVGPWKRYITCRTPRELRNQVAYVAPPTNGQFSILVTGLL